MYTSIRGVVKVKCDYVEFAKQFTNHWKGSKKEELENQYSFVREYFKTERSDSIPNGNDLQWQFEDEKEYFTQRVEDDIFYFSSDLKNYYDDETGLTPIESFLTNILEVIVEEICLLETAYEEYETVNQYDFSKDIINTIEVSNVTNSEKEYFYGTVPEDDKDIFEEYKVKNSLRVFN